MKSHRMTHKLGLVGLVGLVAAATMGLLAGPASADVYKDHSSFDPTGAVFGCAQGDLVVTGGTVDQVFHLNSDGTGIYHATGTLTVHDVTLVDAAGNTYTLSGAGWFGGKSSDPDGNDLILATDTEHFVIHDASGGVYAKVQMVEHMSPDGTSFAFDRGTCMPPQD